MTRSAAGLDLSPASSVLRLLRAWPAVAVLWCFALLAPAAAQNIQHTKSAADLNLRGGLTVNPSTRAVELDITLGNYPGRAGLNLPVKLSYSSKVWRIAYQGYVPGHVGSSGPTGTGYTTAAAKYAEYTSAGWTSSFGFPVLDVPGQEEVYRQDGNGALSPGTPGNNCSDTGCFNVDRLRVRMPDGSTHELRSTDQPYDANNPPQLPDDLYAVDGSRMRYQRSTRTLFLPDGSRYVNLFGSPQRYVDRHGNTLTFDAAGHTWTDTLGRTVLDPMAAPVDAQGNQTYTMPGVGGAPVTYALRWRRLGDPGVLTAPEALRYVADQGCPQSSEQGGSPYLFASGANNTHICNAGGPGQFFNPFVLYQIVLPTGQAYTFTYNVYGEIDKVALPTGGYERFEYGQFMGLSSMSYPYAYANRGVTSRRVSATGAQADEQTWTYTGSGGFVGVEAPDGTLSQRYVHTDAPMSGSFGYSPESPRAGRAYDERVYSAPDPATGQRRLLWRKLTKWGVTGTNAGGVFTTAVQSARRNARVEKEVVMAVEQSGGALAKTTVYGYGEETYRFTTGVNLRSVTEYDFVAVSQGTAETGGVDSMPVPAGPLRVTEYDYLDDVDASYRGRNLLGLGKETRVKDATGAVVSRAAVGYDEAAPADCPAIIRREAGYGADFTVRGDATSVTRYLDAAGMTGPVTTRSGYDIAGNVVSTTDANNNTSTVSYADFFSDGNNGRGTYAYPTSATSAAPNPAFEYGAPAGTFGSTTGLVTSTAYDFSTGLITSATDANTQPTSFDYTDPLNRLKQVARPDGGRITYNYVDAGSCGAYVETRTLLDASGRETDSYQFFDGLGRPHLSETYDGQDANNPWLRVDTRYDALGRVSQVSNPYRAPGCGTSPNPSGRWTTTGYDALGRVTAVTTVDGAAVTTSYSGTAVTVTDQAGRKRSSVSDALGRLTQVTEDPGGLNYVTGYTYDALGNLRTVTQDTQTRSFVYDSLSRLRSATNPESGTVSYTYDANGDLKTRVDARGVTTTYTYDHLSRNILVAYTDGTPGVKRIYDGAANGRGLFYAGWTWDGASNYYTLQAVDGYDAVGRPLNRRQHFYRDNAPGEAFDTAVAYNLAGGVTREVYPSGHAVDYNYDAAGRLGDNAALPAFSGNLGGEQRAYSSQVLYDETGGMSQERFGSDTPVYDKHFYNVRGQLNEIRVSTYPVTDQAHKTDWNRGAILNVYSGAPADGWTGSGADNNGNLRKQMIYVPYDGGSWDSAMFYDHDALNRLRQAREVRNEQNQWVQYFDYDRWGNRTINAGATSNAPAAQFELDAARNDNRLYAPGDTAISDPAQRRMRYDAAGNLTRDVCGNNGLCARSYDAEGRMVSAQTVSSQSATYTYDADGRRVKRNDGSAEVWQVYGLGGELLAEYAAGASYLQPQKEYGYRGGELLVTAEAGAGAWGPAPTFTGPDPLQRGDKILLEHLTDLRTAVNQLRRHAGLSDYDFTTDPEPVRKVTTVKAEQIRQLRRALEGALTRLGRPTGGYAHPTLTENVSPIYAADFQELRKQIRDAWRSDAGGMDIRWLVSDQLGTPRMVVDRTGSLVGVTRRDYLPFGEEVAGDQTWRTPERGYKGDTLRQKFTGYEHDGETGLDYAQARYYANIQGRFIGADPLTTSAKPALPQSWNRYAYCLNNPLAYVDPTGLIWGQRDLGNGTSQFHWFKDEDELKAAGDKWTATTNFLVRDPEGGWFALNRFANSYDHLSDYAVAAGLFNGGTAYRMAGLKSPVFGLGETLGNAVDDIQRSDTMRWVMNDRGVQGALLAMGVFAFPSGAAMDVAAEGAAGAGLSMEGMAYETRFLSRHLPGTVESWKLATSRQSAHVFNDLSTLSRVESEIFARGVNTGTVRGAQRFGLYFDEPIGFRVQNGRVTNVLNYGEMKVNGSLYHLEPRTGPAVNK